MNCIKNKCIHASRVKSIIGAVEAKLYSILKTYKKVDLYISPSNFLENKLLSAEGFYKGKTKTIHNFINKEKFTQSNFKTEDYILFVGRLSKEKGIENLAGAAKILKDYKFVVAGSGPEEGVLKGIPNVELAGFVEGTALCELIGKAKLLLLPSVCYENCPLSILEAHSLGVPVVTMNSGGMAELVEDGKTGGLAQEPTPNSVANTIKKCLNDNAYKKLKENCEREGQNIMGVKEYCEILFEKYNNLNFKG